MSANNITNISTLILQFNANGLKNHINVLETVLYNKRIDIALITETHFTKYTHINIPGYKVLKTNHPDNTAQGGVAIIIKSSIVYQPLPNFCQEYLQSCALVTKINNVPVTIAAVYSPPKHKITNQIFTDYFNSINNNFIAGGDYNAKHLAWGCRVNNPRGIVLQNFISTKNYKILAPPGPTYWPTSTRKNPDILDIFVTKIPSNLNCYTENLLELNSDHSSILLTISAAPLIRLESPKLFKPSTDKNKFHDLVNQQIKLNVKLKSTNDIDHAVNNFTKLIQSAAWSSTPETLTSFHNPLLPEYIRCIIVEKRRARAIFQRTRLPSHKHKYNKLTNYLKKVLAKHKSETFNNFLSNLSPKDGSLWRATKNICKFKTSNLPIKNPDGSYVTSDADKAELFKVHLSDIFQPHPDIYSQTNTNIVEDFLNSPPYLPSNPIKHFTPNDIKYAINKYSLKKSPGFDLVTAEVARCLPNKAFIHLSHIFNSIIRLSYFPMLWKFSIIILVPKPNKPPDSITSF
uniref:RNA-directed DNA polymerase from mobile element jockey n=1 Tax=Sipha flava TaxID=143950 RepID=A0A2S2Q5M2_9HEMI